MSRERVECNLDLLGLVILENKLKPETIPVISMLNNAAVKVVMATGDNVLTATAIGRDCGIVNSEQTLIQIEVHGKFESKPKLCFTKNSEYKTQKQYDLLNGFHDCEGESTKDFSNKNFCDK